MQTNSVAVEQVNSLSFVKKANLCNKFGYKKKQITLLLLHTTLLMIFSFTTGRLLSQTTVFSQGFSSSTSVLSYVNLFPNSGQFDAISSAGTSSTSISSGALRFTRGSGNTSFTRSTNFSPTLTALVYKFDITISGTPTGNTGSAATFQVGSSYNILTNNVEPDANTYAMLSVDFRGTSNFRFRDASNGNTSSNYSVGTTYSVTWAMNNSGSPLTYTAPNGSSETVGNDRADIWVGTTRIWNEANVETSGGALTDLKFAFTQSTGNISIDNINIYSINPFITTQPASVSVCAGGTASFSTAASGTSLSYQWKKNGANLTNGGNISGATTASLTINPVTIADADIYSVDVTSSGGYTASSNNATLTVAPVPTITSSATANAVCNSSSAQNSGLSYSATTGSPTHYSITWDGTALAAGLVNVSSTLLPASPITIPVAAGVAAATYNGTLIVSNASCSNTGNAFTLTINPLPTITGTLNLCTGATTQLNGSGVPAGSTPWVSATTGVATVNSTGLVSRVSNGTSVITYTNNSGCSQSATVSVNTPPGALSMSPSATSTCNGTVKSITVTNYQNNSPQTNSSGAISLTIPDNLSSGAASTISVSGIPADAVITGISVNFNISHTYDNDLVLNLKAPNNNVLNLVNRRGGSGNNFINTVISSDGVTAVSSGSAPFTGTYLPDAAISVGATSNVSNAAAFSSLYSTPNGNWIFSGRDVANGDEGNITSWSITITYSLPAITWTTNVTDLYADLAASIPYTSQNTAKVYAAPTSTQIYTATATASNGCTASNSVTVSVIAPPTITTAATAANVCESTSAQNSTLTYSALTGTPTLYSVTWDAPALAAGLVNISNMAITSSPLTIPIAANVAAGTYTGSVAVRNTGCTGAGSTFTLTINPVPTIASSATGITKCFRNIAQNGVLAYSSTTHSPTLYSINWDAAALSAGLTNLASTALSGSPVFFPIAASTAEGTYNGTITVTNGFGCSNNGNAFTQQIVDLPTITPAAAAANKCFSSSSQTSTLTFSTTGSPSLYSITWDAAAISAGMTNLGWTTLPASPLSVPVAAGVTAGTYNGSVRVMNGTGCQSASAVAFTLTIVNSAPPVMTSASTASICSGGTVNIPLTSNIPATYTWIATDNINVTGESTSLQTTSTLNNTLTNILTTARTVIYTVRPSSAGVCEGAPQTVTVTVNPTPTITASATAAPRCYNTSAQTSTLGYSATTASPTSYNIIWNAAALAAGLVNTGNLSLPPSQFTFSIPAGVAAGTYTGTLTVVTASGCSSSGHTFTVTITPAPSISSQPVNTTVCSGASASFSITAVGTSMSYQWRKGTTNLCNCANISGATSSTLIINPAAAGDAAANYNCVVTSAGCAVVISNFATLTVTPAATAPAALPKDLVFPTVSTTSILGSFTGSADATHYLVIRKTVNVAPTSPANGTTYPLNSTALTGTVDYAGTSTSFNSNGLTPGTTYYYWVFPYNTSTCGTSPMYLTTTPLTGAASTATNVACGTVTPLYWGGTGSNLPGAVSGTDFNTATNWSTSSSTYAASPAAPTECNDVSLALTGGATITLSSTTSVYALTFTLSGNNTTATLSTAGNTLTVNSNAVIDVLSGNTNTNIYIGEASAGAGIIDFKGNFRIGETYFSGSIPKSYVVGNVNSKIIFRGDVLFGRTARFVLPGGVSYPPSYPLAVPGTGTTPGTLEFDGPGLQQVLWNNNVYYDCFYNIVVGNQNKPYVKHVTGTYTPDNVLGDFTINDGCTVDLGTSQWIREQSGGTFTMNGSAKLIIGNNQSIQSNCGFGCNTGVTIPGSNFPGGFATMNISPSSTIEYNGGNNITQTVYSAPTYGNLILSNITGTGTASKISTGVVTLNGGMTVSDKTTFTPGAGVTVNSGTATINSGGTLVCGTNVVSGGGTFALAAGGTITIGSTAGITSSGASGNIQTGSRNFSTGGNYTYNAASAQQAGNGLPTTVNNLTIANAAGVTMFAAATDYTVAGILNLSAGPLSINGNNLIINSLQRSSGTLTGSATSSVGVTGTGVPLFFTTGGRLLKNLVLAASASADLQTPLDITAGSAAGSVSAGSGAILNTFGYLTLKSDASGTARVAEIPVDGSGNALGNINGNVTIERYIPAKRAWRMVTAPVQAAGTQTINEAWQEGVVNSDLTNNQNPDPGFGVHISGADPSLGFDATPLNNPSLKIFNRSTSGWDGIPNTNSTLVRDYEGYMLFVRGSRSTNLNMNIGAPLSNTVIRETDGIRMGRQSVTLSSGAGSYSIVGNPYPSTIDFRTVSVTGAGSASTFILWDPALTGTNGVGAFQYFTQSGGAGSDYTVFPGGGSYGVAGTVNNFVQSGQAFLVQNSGAATLTINEAAKTSSSSSTVFRPMPDNITGRISTILYGKDTDSTFTVLDGGLVMYRSEYDDNLDLDDVKKATNTNSENFGLNKEGSIYQVEKRQTISENDTIHYNMRNLRARPYQLVVELKNMESAGLIAYLKDNYTGISTTLDYGTPYKLDFTPVNAAPGSYAADRFKIFFKQADVLPVTFTSLVAYRKNNAVNVQWKVENEAGIRHYEVERSADGVHFSKIGQDVSATNSSAYQFEDESPLQGLNYFRVKAVETNRRKMYTNIAKLYFGKTASGSTVFPNPVVDGRINIYINGGEKGDYHTNLFNSNGQLIQTNKLGQLNGNANTTIEINKELPHGNYILEIVKPDLSKEHINIVY